MVETILVLVAAALTVTILPMYVDLGRGRLHRTDLMAGDEGDD